MILIHTFVFCG